MPIGTIYQRQRAGFACGLNLVLTLFIPIILLFFMGIVPAWALDPSKTISQFGHTAWRLRDGYFTGNPFAIAQTSDGYIWIGTESGMWRFDGVRFAPWNPPAGSSPLKVVLKLLASQDGSLWIGTINGLSRWKDQRFITYTDAPGLVRAILERSNGEIWFTRSQPFTVTAEKGLCQVVGEQARCYGNGDVSFVSPHALAEDSSGALWIGASEGLYRWTPDSWTYYGPTELKGRRSPGVTSILAPHDHPLLIGVQATGRKLGLEQLMNGSWKQFVMRQLDGSKLDVTAMLLDRQNTLWLGTEDQGVLRVHGSQVDHFAQSDGLSSDVVMVHGLFEDHEGNVWVVTTRGLDCFRDLAVTTFSKREGLASDEIDAVLAAHEGSVWLGEPGGLEALQPGNAFAVRWHRNLPGKQVTALLEDHAGRLWVGIDNSLNVLEDGHFRPIRGLAGKPVGFVVGMTEDVNHDIWAETSGSPRTLYRIRDFQVLAAFPAPQMPAARNLAADPHGGVWLGLVSGDLARYADGKLDVFPFKHSSSPGQDTVVDDLVVNPDGWVMGATPFGLIVWKDGKRLTLNVHNGLPCDSIHAAITDKDGALWLYAQCGLLRIASSELLKWWASPEAVLQVRVFDALDGAEPGHAPFNAAAKTTDGRLWFTNNHSLQMMDPARVEQTNAPVPLVHVEELIADHRPYAEFPNLSLPPATRDLEIDYTAPSFAEPQKVLFRYRLEGRDRSWQEAGTRRQAFYTDLSPGRYRFRVIASSGEGVWNEAGATVDFRVPPAWYQTAWFRILSALAALLLLWFLHRMRLWQVARALSTRSDERLAERTRMARELHDTFVQTIHGSKMVVDDALEKPSDAAGMHSALIKLAVWLERAIHESRAALNSLRESTSERNDLRVAFQRVTESRFIPRSMAVNLSVVGEAREMHPIVRDEIYRIGYEAIHNAAQHSRASRLDIEVRYNGDFTLRVKDNGIGIDPAMLDRGKEGHFGLQGMRERAGRIGGKLTLVSNINAGTVITLVVPARVVYRSANESLLNRAIERIERVLR